MSRHNDTRDTRARAVRSAIPALLVYTTFAVTACATATPAPRLGDALLPAGVSHAPPAAESRFSYIVTADELVDDHSATMYTFIASRWPSMVFGDPPRGGGSYGAVLSPTDDRFGVYDARGAYLGGPEFLLNVLPSAVQQLRRLTSMEEHTLFGRGHPAGAVILTWSGRARR
jgi:hypothetical protein